MSGGRYSSSKVQIIPEENLIKELTFDEAKTMLDRFNNSVTNGKLTLEEYFIRFPQHDKVLRNYVTTTERQKQSTQGLVKASQEARAAQIAQNEAIKNSTLSAKAGQVALKGLAIAGNMIAMWVITKGIELAAKAIDQFVNSAKYCKERVNEVMDSFNSMTSKINTNAKTISEISDRYTELSKHVNRLGENVSLTEDEFEEYHSITSKIAEMYPSLVDGWDAQSNAIVNLKGDLSELNAEYEKSVHNANLLLMESKDDIFKNYQNTIKDINRNIQYAEKAMEIVKSQGSFYDIIYDDEGMKTSYYYHFEDLGLSLDDMLANNLDTIERQLTLKIQSLKDEADNAAKDVTPLLKAILQEDLDYQGFSDELQNATSFIIDQIPVSLMNAITSKGSSAGSDFIERLVDEINANEEVQNAILQLFTVDLTELSPTEAEELVDSYISIIQDTFDSLGYEVGIEDLKVNLDFEEVDTLANNYNEILKKATEKFSGVTAQTYGNNADNDLYYEQVQDELATFAKENSINTQDEIAFWNQCIEESNTRQEAMDKYLASPYMANDPTSFSNIFSLQNTEGEFTTLGHLNEQLDKIQSAYKNLFDAMDTYSSAGYITIDQFQAIVEQGSEFLDYLELEDGQLSLNKNAMYDLAKARIVEMKAQMIQGVVNQVSQIKEEEDARRYLESTNYDLKRSYEELTATQLSNWAVSSELSQESKNAVLEKAWGDIDKINALVAKIDLGSIGDGASSAAQSITELLDKELDVLDKKMEAGYIDFNDYIAARLDLIENYYEKGKLSADEYYSYLEKHYNKELSYMDKAVNAVTRRIDKEIDALEKQKDKIESSYQAQIDSLEEQKTLLQEANKERERQLNLQKALYELERAQHQRTTLMYSEEKGMHYVTDNDAIRDAQQEAEDAEFEIKISEIESAIYKLEEARDRETEAIDEMISKLQEYKDWWQDITSAYEEEQENLIAAQILGQDWEQQILEGRLDTLNKFKDDYIAIQQAMVDAAYQAAQAMANAQNVTIGDSSKGKTSLVDNSPAHGWEVIDESTATRVGKGFATEAEAEAYRDNLNEQKAASLGMTAEQFNNSNIPGYYAKKYHTGLQQGLVNKNSFDDDFKLVQKVGLGQKDVMAILKEGEVVATPEQVSNLADGLRRSGIELPSHLIPVADNHPLMQVCRKFAALLDCNAIPQLANAFWQQSNNDPAKAASNINHISNSNNRMQQISIGDINISCPGVTSQEVMKQVGDALNRQFSGMALSAMQKSMKQ